MRCRTQGAVPGAERGSVTAETAVALPALIVVLVTTVWGVGAAAAQVACVDAARAGAREAARGEPLAAVRSAVLRAAPPAASVEIVRDRLLTRVTVRAVARAPLAGLLPPLTLRAGVVAATEPEGPMPGRGGAMTSEITPSSGSHVVGDVVTRPGMSSHGRAVGDDRRLPSGVLRVRALRRTRTRPRREHRSPDRRWPRDREGETAR